MADNNENLAIESNLFSEYSTPKSLKDVLLQYKNKINEDTVTKFNVFRPKIYDGYLCAVKRRNFNPFNKIFVCFTDSDDVSEGAIDAGGPKRELFRLLLRYLKDSKIFIGTENSKNLVYDKDSLDQSHYFEAGTFIIIKV